MKNKLLIIAGFLIFLASCSKENRTIEQPDVIGKWNLTYITNERNNLYITPNVDNVTFEFSKNTVFIDNDCYAYKKGAYSYILKTENYFQPEGDLPKSRVLKIADSRYLLEMTYDGKAMSLTNYSGSVTTMKLEKE